MTQLLKWPVIEAIEQGEPRILLYGPPGTGKTRSAFNAAKSKRKKFYNVTLSDETSAAEIRGHFVPKGPGAWIWMNGPAMLAYINGGMLVLNEIDKASQDCLDFLHGLLDDAVMACITLPNGKTVKPKTGFQVIATMNGEPADLPEALQDRFSVAIEITEPHPDAIKSLPQDLQGAAKKIESYEHQQRPATIRRWMAFSSLRDMEGVTVEDAAKAVFGHRAKELMDAYKLSASATNTTDDKPKAKTTRARASATVSEEDDESDPEPDVDEEEDDDDERCSCVSCVRERAFASYGIDPDVGLEPDDDGDYACPECDEFYGDETTAIQCCYDD